MWKWNYIKNIPAHVSSQIKKSKNRPQKKSLGKQDHVKEYQSKDNKVALQQNVPAVQLKEHNSSIFDFPLCSQNY